MTSLQQPLTYTDLDVSDYLLHIPPIPTIQASLAEQAKSYLDQCETILLNLHKDNYVSHHMLNVRSLMIDQLIKYLFCEFEKETIQKTHYEGPQACLVAQGGYGRKEMNFKSDIDLLFIYPKTRGQYIELITEKMLYLLWDLKMDVGYATRTIKECKQRFLEDVTIMTSLLDARYLCGDHASFDQLVGDINSILHQQSTQQILIEQKLDEKIKRIKKNGNSVFILEPNIKEGYGGLRDLQTVLWLGKLQRSGRSFHDFFKLGVINEDEFNKIIEARNFLWRVRNDLHLSTKRKSDVLNFHRQEEAAKSLGFEEDDTGILGVEKFMQTYYNYTYQIAHITDSMVRRMQERSPSISMTPQKQKREAYDDYFDIVENQLSVKNEKLFQMDPYVMMLLMQAVQKTGLSIDTDTRDAVRYYSEKLDPTFKYRKDAIDLFREMLNSYENLGHMLYVMHDCHFLDEWFPEFKKLRCRVQHDMYHIYTIDTHSIFAVNEISKLAAGEYGDKFSFYKNTLHQIERPELLTLGLFLHDIGKGHGGNHSVIGAEIASHITDRLKYSPDEQKVIDFLISSHLMMPYLSQRRDLDDQELIIQFAKSMGSMDHLNMLLLLTWGDIRAVGPEAWTDWKGDLLQKLYEKTQRVIDEGEFSKEKTQERIARVRDEVMQHIQGRYHEEEFNEFLNIMPPRYYFVMDSPSIEEHFLLREQGKAERIVVGFKESITEGMSQIEVYMPQAVRIFSRITGVMLAFAVNIIRADIFQTRDGHVIVNLMVTDSKGRPLKANQKYKQIEKNLKLVLSDQERVEKILEARKVPDYLTKKPIQKANLKIHIDNDVSAYYTVIDIYTHDRLGLLYDITRILNDHGCYIEVSKISTKVDQVADVFYVKDIFGQKITSKEKLKQIYAALLEVVQS